jgi:hypothetical protein
MLGYNFINQVDGVGCGGICTIEDNFLYYQIKVDGVRLNHLLVECEVECVDRGRI